MAIKKRMSDESKGKLFQFQWDDESAEERAAELTAAGWQVKTETEEGERGFKNCKAFAPDIVLFDLAKKPSHSREVARALRQSNPSARLPSSSWAAAKKTSPKQNKKPPPPNSPPAAP